MINLNLRVNVSILSIDIYYFNLNETFLIIPLPQDENTISETGSVIPIDSRCSLLMLIVRRAFLINARIHHCFQSVRNNSHSYTQRTYFLCVIKYYLPWRLPV